MRADLQIHLLGKIEIPQVLQKMEEKQIDLIGLLYYEWEPRTFYSLREMVFKTQKDYEIEQQNDNVICFQSKATAKQLFVILGQEIATTDGFHLLSIGAAGIEKFLALEEAIKIILEKGGLPIIDHPYADPERRWADISPEKEKILERICEKFKGKIALEWNGYCNSIARYITSVGMATIGMVAKYTNVNRKTEKLGERLGIPVIPTSDLHIKDRWSLGKIGTAHIEIPDKDLDFYDLFESIKEKILRSNFISRKRTVGLHFFFYNYGIPTLRRVVKNS